ncbi:hypothetical protein PENSPDRAFT_735281 [Peniophora sp. CONT]|nr:hypothetical protein PENSPDRAFT_735281 [Peniophora sp. CONT]
MPRPSDVYAKELSTLSRGHAVLNPRRARLQSGGGLRPAVNVGDVAYDYNGQIIRLFNCLAAPDEQDDDCVFPDDFEILELPARTGSVARRGSPVTVIESHARTGPFYSKGVRMLKLEAGASVPAVGCSASIAFATRHEQGAVLLTSNHIKTRISPNRPAFERYMIKHYDSWCSLLEMLELDVRPEDLMLITAVDTTHSWSNLVFSERELRGEFRVEVPVGCIAGGRVGVSMEFSHTQSATRDSGPNPEDMEVADDGSEADYVAVSTPGPAQDDQVIFVRALRGKKRKFSSLKIIASADPKGLDDGHSDDDNDDPALDIEGVGDLRSREDYLTPVLDLILENSDVDLAIIHDDDYGAYLRYMPQGIPRGTVNLILSRTMNGVTYGTLNTQGLEPTAQARSSVVDVERRNVTRSTTSRLSANDFNLPEEPSIIQSATLSTSPLPQNHCRLLRADAERFRRDYKTISHIIERSRDALNAIQALAKRIAETGSEDEGWDEDAMEELLSDLSDLAGEDAQSYLSTLDDVTARVSSIAISADGGLEPGMTESALATRDVVTSVSARGDEVTPVLAPSSTLQQRSYTEPWTNVFAETDVDASTADEYETDFDGSSVSSFPLHEDSLPSSPKSPEAEARLHTAASEHWRQSELFDKLPKQSYPTVDRARPGLLSQLLNTNTPDSRQPAPLSSPAHSQRGLLPIPILPLSRSMMAIPQLSDVSAQASPTLEIGRQRTNSAPAERAYGDNRSGDAAVVCSSPHSLAHQRLAELVDSTRQRRHSLDQKPPRSSSEHSLSSVAPTIPAPLISPWNLGVPKPSMSPQSTRRRMLSTELSESLRRNLLWERQVNKANVRAGPTPLSRINGEPRSSELEKEEWFGQHVVAIARHHSYAG